MSKLDLTSIEDKDMTPAVISGLTDSFRTSTQRFPDALIVTEAQAKQFFFANNEIATNFRGVPIEIQQKTDERATIIKTIDGILSGLHLSRVENLTGVYSMLENMKVKFSGGATSEQTNTV